MNFYLNYTARDKDGQMVFSTQTNSFISQNFIFFLSSYSFFISYSSSQIVRGLPKEWIEIFKAAKVKPKELKDPDTVVFLLEMMDKAMSEMEEEEEEEGAGEKREEGNHSFACFFINLIA